MSILFKNPADDPGEDENALQGLLVFGYQCKLFRDEERAIAIEAGAHLIPWNGDTSITIDRYDGRGHLYDLKPYDADRPDRAGASYVMSKEESRIERLCDEERYLELSIDAAEQQTYEEEELKRLNHELSREPGYAAVGFSYDQPQTSTSDTTPTEPEPEAEEEDEVYLPPPNLKLPPSMIYAPTVKLNAVILKTAQYVAQHGGQMEIMIKTKQATNPQFQFLHFDHQLNPYYKLLVHLIKTGSYKPNETPQQKSYSNDNSQDESDDDDDGGYLHPLLLSAKTKSQPRSTPPPVNCIEDTPYAKLVKQFAPQPKPAPEPEPEPVSPQEKPDREDDRPVSPPDELKPLIERLLTYVSKDGEDFEQQVIARNDPRFSFLTSGDPYYEYYTWRKQQLLLNPPSEQSSETSIPPPKSISFSIKPKEAADPVKLETEPVLPIDEDSDDDLMTIQNAQGSQYLPHGAIPQSQQQTILSPQPIIYNNIPTGPPPHIMYQNIHMPIPGPPPIVHEEPPPPGVTIEASPQIYIPPEITAEEPDEIKRLEDMNKQQERDVKQAKKQAEELRNKLAAAAREKMTQVTAANPEKVLREERKKKAAMFVQMLKRRTDGKAHSAPIGPELPPEKVYELEGNGSVDYNHSLHRRRSSARRRSPERRRPSPPASYRHSNKRRHRERSRSPFSRNRSPSPISRKRLVRDTISPVSSVTSPLRSVMSPLRSVTSPLRSVTPPLIFSHSSQQITGYRSPIPNHILSASTSASNSPARELEAISTVRQQQAENQEELLRKVKKMLKEKRKAVFKEDLLGS